MYSTNMTFIGLNKIELKVKFTDKAGSIPKKTWKNRFFITEIQ